MTKLAAVLLALSAALPAAAQTPTYDLHEWGVFVVPRGSAWAMRDMRREWATLPKFMYGQLPSSRRAPLVDVGCVYKPVVFVHAPKDIPQLRLHVRFSAGRPMVWWPAATWPGRRVPLRKGQPKPSWDAQDLVFDVAVQGVGSPPGPEYKPPAVPAGHWVEHLRRVRCSRLSTAGGPGAEISCWGGRRLPPSRLYERFCYYDGLLQIRSRAKVRRDGAGAVVVTSQSAHDWLDVMVIERRDGAVRVSDWTPRIAAGSQRTRLALRRAEAATLRRLKGELTARLTRAGLNADEAGSLVQTWAAGLFGADGMLLFYRVGQSVYDSWLPLKATPAPRRTARVGLVVLPRLEPELEDRLGVLIRQLGDRRHATRWAATRALARIGGPAFEALERHRVDPDLEVATRCRELLDAGDARPLLRDP